MGMQLCNVKMVNTAAYLPEGDTGNMGWSAEIVYEFQKKGRCNLLNIPVKVNT